LQSSRSEEPRLRQAAVSTENPEVSKIVAEVLRKGGNAFDASVAATFALSVIRPHSTGIGGGGFFLIHQAKTGETTFLDARERAPELMTETSIDEVKISDRGKKGVFVGVPGIVAGAWEVYQRHGSGQVSWSDLLAPAVNLAKNGFKIYPHLSEALSIAETRLGFSLPQGLERDGLFVNSALAKTLSGIASEGPDYFYKGTVADQLVKASQSRGGLLDLSDLSDYRVKYRKPFEFSYKGRKILTSPLPSSGGVVIGQALALRERLGVKGTEAGDIEAQAFLIRSLRLAFRSRALYLGDPDFADIDQEYFLSSTAVKELAKDMVSPSEGRRKVSDFEPIPTSTTHFSIIDREGNIVSSTQSINLYFGAGFIAEGTGVFLNNTLDDFSKTNKSGNAFGLVGRKANFPAGGKTPLSSMSPTIVFNEGRPELVLGSPGGPRIISAVLQTIINKIDYGMSLEKSVNQPRLHTQWDPVTVYLEKRDLKDGLESKLNELGFSIKVSAFLIGNVSALSVSENGSIEAVADPRRDGLGIVVEKEAAVVH